MIKLNNINSALSYGRRIINQGEKRSVNAKKNIIVSFFIKGASILISLVLVPLTIDFVNSTQYGIWLTLSSIVAWFSFFDIGFGNGLRNRFAEAKATGDYEKAKAYVSTTYICLASIFTVVWLLFFAVNFFIDWSIILNAPTQMAKELSLVALIVFSFFCMQIVLKTINTVLVADQKPAKSAFFDMLGQVLALAIIFVLTKTRSGSLLYLSLALGFCPIFIMIISSVWFYNHEYRQYKPTVKLFDKGIVKDIMGLGSKFFLIQVSGVFVFQCTNIIITQKFGTEQVTVYNVVYRYFAVLLMITNIMCLPLWSAFTEAYVQNDFNWMKSVFKKMIKIWRYGIILLIVMFAVSKFVIHIWIGDKVVISYSIAFLMMINILANMGSGMFLSIVGGVGKIKLTLITNVLLSVFYIPLAIYFGKTFNLEGIIFANFLINLVYAILAPIQSYRIINNKAKGIWNE